MLFDGVEVFLKQLLAPLRDGKIVLTNSDIGENNILVSLSDAENIMIIDYEYADWDPMALDLAN